MMPYPCMQMPEGHEHNFSLPSQSFFPAGLCGAEPIFMQTSQRLVTQCAHTKTQACLAKPTGASRFCVPLDQDICTPAHQLQIHTRTCTHTHMHTHAHTHTHTHARTHIHTHTRAHIIHRLDQRTHAHCTCRFIAFLFEHDKALDFVSTDAAQQPILMRWAPWDFREFLPRLWGMLAASVHAKAVPSTCHGRPIWHLPSGT